MLVNHGGDAKTLLYIVCLTHLYTATLAVHTQGVCMTGWYEWVQHSIPNDQRPYCYKVLGETYSTFEGADSKCLMQDGNLLSVQTKEENEFILDLLKDKGVDTVWLGYNTKYLIGSVATWTDSSYVNYTNWSNRYGKKSGCAAFHNDGTWEINECDTVNQVVCKYKQECSTDMNMCPVQSSCRDTPTGYYCFCTSGYMGNGLYCYNTNECFENLDNCHRGRSTCSDTLGSFRCACTGSNSISIYDNSLPDEAGTVCSVCKPPWVEYRNQHGVTDCFLFSNAADFYNGAENTCKGKGGELATIQTADELEFIQAIMSGRAVSAWIGLLKNDADYLWMDNAPLDFAEPITTGDGICFKMDMATGMWLPVQLIEGGTDRSNCMGTYKYICRKRFNECAHITTNPCDPLKAVCDDSAHGYTCTCLAGWAGSGMPGCSDVNECAMGIHQCTPSGENSGCINLPGSYRCGCLPGYQPNLTPSDCVDIRECFVNADNCHKLAECTNTIGSFTCACMAGSDGNGTHCFAENECTVKPDLCGAGGVCINIKDGNGYTCNCKAGFLLNDASTMCYDYDECQAYSSASDGKCSHDSICINTMGDYECKCRKGYRDQQTPRNKHDVMCADIDECMEQENVCGGNTTCQNVPGMFFCTPIFWGRKEHAEIGAPMWIVVLLAGLFIIIAVVLLILLATYRRKLMFMHKVIPHRNKGVQHGQTHVKWSRDDQERVRLIRKGVDSPLSHGVPSDLKMHGGKVLLTSESLHGEKHVRFSPSASPHPAERPSLPVLPPRMNRIYGGEVQAQTSMTEQDPSLTVTPSSGGASQLQMSIQHIPKQPVSEPDFGPQGDAFSTRTLPPLPPRQNTVWGEEMNVQTSPQMSASLQNTPYQDDSKSRSQSRPQSISLANKNNYKPPSQNTKDKNASDTASDSDVKSVTKASSGQSDIEIVRNYASAGSTKRSNQEFSLPGSPTDPRKPRKSKGRDSNTSSRSESRKPKKQASTTTSPSSGGDSLPDSPIQPGKRSKRGSKASQKSGPRGRRDTRKSASSKRDSSITTTSRSTVSPGRDAPSNDRAESSRNTTQSSLSKSVGKDDTDTQ